MLEACTTYALVYQLFPLSTRPPCWYQMASPSQHRPRADRCSSSSSCLRTSHRCRPPNTAGSLARRRVDRETGHNWGRYSCPRRGGQSQRWRRLRANWNRETTTLGCFIGSDKIMKAVPEHSLLCGPISPVVNLEMSSTARFSCGNAIYGCSGLVNCHMLIFLSIAFVLIGLISLLIMWNHSITNIFQRLRFCVYTHIFNSQDLKKMYPCRFVAPTFPSCPVHSCRDVRGVTWDATTTREVYEARAIPAAPTPPAGHTGDCNNKWHVSHVDVSKEQF